jgi:hypothetical protein
MRIAAGGFVLLAGAFLFLMLRRDVRLAARERL